MIRKHHWQIVTVSSQVDTWAAMAHPVTNSMGTYTGKQGSTLIIILPPQA